MQEYDVTLKLLLKGSAKLTMRELTGTEVVKWLDAELPKIRKVQNLRLDLLGRTAEGELIHIELQSSNDSAMPFRMIDYCLGVQRLFRKYPRQIVLYVGEAPMRMETKLRGPGLSFEYDLIDVRKLNGERLLKSAEVGDNVIAILAKLRDDRKAVHRIVSRIAGLAMTERETAVAQLMILAGLRHLAAAVKEETEKMPIDLDIRDHEVIGPMIVQAEKKGRQEGLQAGELTVLRRLIEKRFGVLPKRAGKKLAAMSAPQLEELSERLLDASSIDELLR